MGRNRVVAPGSERKLLADGDFIELKRELNVGDAKRVEAAGNRPTIIGGRLYYVTDWTVHDFERALVYLTNWNLTGPDGNLLPINIDAIRSLDSETFTEINKLIVEYVLESATKKLEAARAAIQARMTTTDSTPPTPTSSELPESVQT